MVKKVLFGTLAVIVLAAVGLVGLNAVQRQAGAARAQEAWIAAEPAPLPDIGSTRTLRVTPLYEEAGGGAYATGHGLSYLVETDDATVLVDLGASADAVAQNAAQMGVDLSTVDAVVITHPHPDHLGRAAWPTPGTVFTNAGRRVPEDGSLPLADVPVIAPVPTTFAGREATVATHPVKVAEGIATSGAITFVQVPVYALAGGTAEEQAVAVRVEGEGIVLIVGCGHPSVATLLTRAAELFDEPVVGVVGGLHYGEMTAEQLAPELAHLGALDLRLIALSPHDSEQPARDAFAAAFPDAVQVIEVGRTIAFGG